MKTPPPVIVLCALLPIIGIAQVNLPTASELAALERFASRPTARATWSKDVERIDSGQTHAVITALVVEDATQVPRQMRGIRIDLTSQDLLDQVYVAEEFLEPLMKALDEISTGFGSFLSRRPSSGSRCFGSCAFLSAMREGAHFFSASQCAMADG